jgi:hypothetical protein
MNTHAEVKRALQADGTKLETLALATGFTGGRLNIGDIRYISKANSVGVYLKKDGEQGSGSFLDYDKAADWTIDGDVITHRLGMSYRVLSKAVN